jgi:hypothetical protein
MKPLATVLRNMDPKRPVGNAHDFTTTRNSGCDAAHDRRQCNSSEETIMRTTTISGLAAVAFLLAAMAAPVHAAKRIDCQMRFSLAGWSAFYKTASGDGTVTCDNGQKMKVHIEAKGGGLTFGKSEIHNGLGKFSEVYDIDQVLGVYASAGAHAGAVNSAEAQALTKGAVSLALSGKGTGWDLGIAFGKFTISRR